jgi:hypothetical protein
MNWKSLMSDSFNIYGLAIGTLIATPLGPWLVQDLRPGDFIETLDEGPKPVLWVGQTELYEPAPAVKISAGVLANTAAARVGLDHLVMIDGVDCELLFGEAEIFVKAQDLLGLPGIHLDVFGPVSSYFHLMVEGHQIILANGVPVESLHPGLIDSETEALEIRDALKDCITPWDVQRICALPPALTVLSAQEASVLRSLRMKMRTAHKERKLFGRFAA